MKRLFLFLTSIPFTCSAQQNSAYTDSIYSYQQHYKSEFLSDERSPLKAEDTAFIRFYKPDKHYRIVAKLQLTPNAKAFDMPTASGATKKYKQYALATFSIKDTIVTLQVLQSQKLIKQSKYKNYLFIPFKDNSNYIETYAGGRYIDLSTDDILNGWIEIDFNKSYNPWCAFSIGYSCPIPPPENKLPVTIRAGEKTFAKESKH